MLFSTIIQDTFPSVTPQLFERISSYLLFGSFIIFLFFQAPGADSLIPTVTPCYSSIYDVIPHLFLPQFTQAHIYFCIFSFSFIQAAFL